MSSPAATPARAALKGSGDGALPPMLEQYVSLRDAHPEHLMLFQVGDFYETFGEDAERLSRLLGIVLTHKSSKGFSTPMAGVPVRAADSAIERLLNRGVRVAVADQTEPPGSGLVERRVTQLLTPGTVTEERHLPAGESYLAAAATGDGYALALLDVSTGEFRCASFTTRAALTDELARCGVRELLLAPELQGNAEVLGELQSRFPVMQSSAPFDPESGRAAIAATLGALPPEVNTPGLLRACGAALAYAAANIGPLGMVRRLSRYAPGATLDLPGTTLRALEVFTPQGEGGLTLQAVLGPCRTAGGARLLRAWLRSPLREARDIAARQGAVAALVADPERRAGLRGLLHQAHDLERLSARLAGGRASPRDVLALARTLALLPGLRAALAGSGELERRADRLGPLEGLAAQVSGALCDEVPRHLEDGGVIREGHCPELDLLRAQVGSARADIAALEGQERARSGVNGLKVGYNAVLGYYLEVPRSAAGRVPAEWRQIATLKERARFTHPKLRELEAHLQALTLEERRREAALFAALRAELAGHVEALQTAAGVFSELDLLATLAEVAARRGWVRPQSGDALELVQARHPVVEAALGHGFVPNDLRLGGGHGCAALVTGPNMAGKSTFLRTAALCALLHQIGAFVPAESATLPLFDGIYTRIGAHDDLAGGRSTFMVEMSELADILHRAGPGSLVLLDEVGRGTSSRDGLAVAQAALESLHARGCPTLFATHYFELTRLEGELPGLRNLHVAAQEEAGGLTFYHQVLPGAAHSSYGIEVARMAGLPGPVVDRAARLLLGLNVAQEEGGVTRALLALDLARLTPFEAHEALRRLQALATAEPATREETVTP